jgi:hypothetical protein
MTVPPAPIPQGSQTWLPADHSGIAYDFTKLETMPDTLYEADGYKEEVGANGWEVTRVYQCAWSDVARAMQWLYGYSTLPDQDAANLSTIGPNGQTVIAQIPPNGGAGRLVIMSSTGSINRVPPAQDPYRPYLYCDHVELVEGQGAWLQDCGTALRNINGDFIDEQGNLLFPNGNAPPLPAGFVIPQAAVPLPAMVYAEQEPGALGGNELGYVFADGQAKLRATFRQRPYIVQNDTQMLATGKGEISRYVERESRYAIQGLPLQNVAKADPANQLLFIPGGPYAGKLIPEAGVILLPTASFQYVWNEVPFYPLAAIAACQGRVNSQDFDGLRGWPLLPAGTALCQAPEIKVRRNICGQMSFTVTWILDYREMGWNQFPAGDGNFYTATWGGGPPADDGSNLVFKPTDFGQLFEVPNASPWG